MISFNKMVDKMIYETEILEICNKKISVIQVVDDTILVGACSMTSLKIRVMTRHEFCNYTCIIPAYFTIFQDIPYQIEIKLHKAAASVQDNISQNNFDFCQATQDCAFSDVISQICKFSLQLQQIGRKMK